MRSYSRYNLKSIVLALVLILSHGFMCTRGVPVKPRRALIVFISGLGGDPAIFTGEGLLLSQIQKELSESKIMDGRIDCYASFRKPEDTRMNSIPEQSENLWKKVIQTYPDIKTSGISLILITHGQGYLVGSQMIKEHYEEAKFKALIGLGGVVNGASITEKDEGTIQALMVTLIGKIKEMKVGLWRKGGISDVPSGGKETESNEDVQGDFMARLAEELTEEKLAGILRELIGIGKSGRGIDWNKISKELYKYYLTGEMYSEENNILL